MWGEGVGMRRVRGVAKARASDPELRQRSSTSNKGWGLSRSGRRRAPVSSFPSWTTSHLLRDAGVLPSSWPRLPRAPGSASQHAPRMDPKDGQCSLATQSALIILFSNSPRYIFPFSSAQLSPSRVRSLLPFIQASANHLPRQQGSWVQVAFSLLLVPSQSMGLSCF